MSAGPWIDLPLSASFTAVAGEGNKYRLRDGDIVDLKFTVTKAAAGRVIATLPPEFSPPGEQRFVYAMDADAAVGSVTPDGAVTDRDQDEPLTGKVLAGSMTLYLTPKSGPPPAITSVDVTEMHTNFTRPVVITGTGFIATTVLSASPGGKVLIQAPTVVSDTEIRASISGLGSTSSDFVLIASNGAVKSNEFPMTLVATPASTFVSITPNTGAVNVPVTVRMVVSGEPLDPTPGAISWIADKPYPVTWISATEFDVAYVPSTGTVPQTQTIMCSHWGTYLLGGVSFAVTP